MGYKQWDKSSALVQKGMFGYKQKPGQPVVRAVAKSKLTCIDLGGAGDCGFRAAAAAMIDNILFKSRANQELARKLLEFHATYFEQERMPSRLMTPAEHFSILIEHSSRAKFLVELAYALRQATVN